MKSTKICEYFNQIWPFITYTAVLTQANGMVHVHDKPIVNTFQENCLIRGYKRGRIGGNSNHASKKKIMRDLVTGP